MATWIFPSDLLAVVTVLASELHSRLSWRLAPLLMGALLSQGRHTVASWLRANRLGGDHANFYYFLSSLGRSAKAIATTLLLELVKRLPLPARLLFVIDDTPTKRAGPHVQGAGYHHNPTPGPGGGDTLYGHVWVTLAWATTHPLWGTIALPLWALLYVREKEIATLPKTSQLTFRTKLELAIEQMRWLATTLRFLGKELWLVADGFYAKANVIGEALSLGIVFVGRLRSDARLFAKVKQPRRRKRGRPRQYGPRLDPAKRAGQKQGWKKEIFSLYGKQVEKQYKLFPAMLRSAGVEVLVMLVRNEKSWVMFFTTKLDATAREIIETYAQRASIEQMFHDLKEVHGTGQAQVRNLWANVGAFHVTLWLLTLIELWSWKRSRRQLVDRRDSPWDDPQRRPSHADRRNALKSMLLRDAFSAAGLAQALPKKFLALWNATMKLAA